MRAIFDKQLADMKDLLAMDQREIDIVKAQGDERALQRARDRAQLRIERYKELRASRDKMLAEVQRGKTDIEFSALDKLGACELRELVLQPKGVRLGFFGLVWVPSR